ncbi:short-chain dehydrogenase [Paenibacillus glucanolyticus]|uniref:SDR family oxidoreductase n=1 Tax=Paenibacillus TaxID=44249 RepID=UPI0004B3BBD2|nr:MULTISPECIES: SDR family oxidoreductase [Paenibacillus]AVV56716.1 short-chain dehydrogenase [Paenibacillus glucanolyticus]MPY18692.1 SDR family oxidoreductase [Paenibacillus glucanolyticus]
MIAGTGKVALVTGASSGFGLLISLELAQAGYDVAAGHRRPEAAQELMTRAEQAGVAERIHRVRLDICDEEQVRAVALHLEQRFGRLDVLVNNAGEAVGGMVEEVPLSGWRRQMETNFFGTVSVTQHMLPLMRRTENSKIILMSSISGVVGFPGYGPYASSKFAIEGFGESLSLELMPFGMHVVLVQPGAYGTPIWNKSFGELEVKEGSPYSDMLKGVLDYSERTARGSGNPLEVAKLVARIASMSKPRFRYKLPQGTRITAWIKGLLPDRWFQQMIYRMLGRR